MGKPSVHTKQVIEEALRAGRGVYVDAAATLGVNEATIRRAVKRFGLDIASYLPESPSVEPARIASHKHDVDFYRRRNAELERDLSYAHKLRESIYELQPANIHAPEWTWKTSKRRTELPILFTSDIQYGEVIRKEELDGHNEYNVAVANRRYRDLIESTIDICKNYRRCDRYPGIILLRGGDSISGDIHDELIQTNEVPSTMQVAGLFAEEKRGIQLLKEEFGNVSVFSVPGNHGRLTKKPQAKRFVEWNFDHLLTLMLEKAFEGDRSVSFVHPVAGDVFFNALNTRILLTHGDRIGSRGGQGFVGASATVARGSKKTRDAYSAMGKTVDWVLMGHFHEFMVLPNTIVNGSLPGYSEFAAMNRMRPEPPSQALLFVDSNYGLNEIRRVVLK